MFLPRHDKAIELRDGRHLGYTEYGRKDGSPVLVLEPVGLGLLGLFGQWAASSADVRLITPTRPGFRHSDPNTGGTLQDWADDLQQLLDRLAIPETAVVATFSASAAALTAAQHMKTRIVSLALLNPATPTSLGLARGSPLHKHVGHRHLANVLRPPSERRLISDLVRSLAPSDRNIVFDPDIGPQMLAMFRHTASRLPAVRAELELFNRSWPADLGAVEAEVSIWHGTADSLHPPSAATEIKRQLPQARVFRFHNQGALWFVDPTSGSAQIAPPS